MPPLALTLAALALLAGDPRLDESQVREVIELLEKGSAAPEADIADWKGRIAPRRAEIESVLSSLVATDRAKDAIRLASAIGRFWPEREALAWHRQVLGMASGKSFPERIPLLLAASSRAFHVGDQDTTRRWAQEALDLARAAHDGKRMATAYFRLSQVELRRHDLPAFHRANDAMLGVCREMKDESCEVGVRNMAGEAARVEGNLVLAAELNERNRAYGAEHGVASAVRNATFNLAFIDLARGKTERVRERLEEALRMFRAVQNDAILTVVVAGMAMLSLLEGDPVRAARLFGASAAKLEALGMIPDPADQDQIRTFTKRLESELGRSGFRNAFDAGRRMRFDDALDEAMRLPAS